MSSIIYQRALLFLAFLQMCELVSQKSDKTLLKKKKDLTLENNPITFQVKSGTF